MWAHSKCDLTNNLYNCNMTCQLLYSLLMTLTHEGQVHPTLPSHPPYLYHNFQGTMYLYTSVSFQNVMVNQVDSKLLSTNTAVPCLWMLSSPAPVSLFFLPKSHCTISLYCHNTHCTVTFAFISFWDLPSR